MRKMKNAKFALKATDVPLLQQSMRLPEKFTFAIPQPVSE